MIERTNEDGIETIRLAHGKVSALDVELLEAITQALGEAASSADAIVLTGTGSAFSAGVDLFRMLDEGEAYISRFLPALDDTLRTLFSLPVPVVAAINGHAIAGGCVVALACDYKVMSTGRMGIPELLVGVPFPVSAFEVVRFALSPAVMQKVIYTGRTVESDEAFSLGMIDEVVGEGEVKERALGMARQMASVPKVTFRLTKSQLRAATVEKISRLDDSFDPDIRRVWNDPEIHAVIRAYLDKTLGK